MARRTTIKLKSLNSFNGHRVQTTFLISYPKPEGDEHEIEFTVDFEAAGVNPSEYVSRSALILKQRLDQAAEAASEFAALVDAK